MYMPPKDKFQVKLFKLPSLRSGGLLLDFVLFVVLFGLLSTAIRGRIGDDDDAVGLQGSPLLLVVVVDAVPVGQDRQVSVRGAVPSWNLGLESSKM